MNLIFEAQLRQRPYGKRRVAQPAIPVVPVPHPSYAPRVFYGRTLPALKDHKKLGVSFSWKEHTYVLSSTLDPEEVNVFHHNGMAEARFVIRAGERVCFFAGLF